VIFLLYSIASSAKYRPVVFSDEVLAETHHESVMRLNFWR